MRDLAPHCTTPSAAAPKRERADAEANKQTKRAGRKLPPDWAQEFLDFYGITNTLARPNNSAWVYAETIYFANFRDVRRPSGCHFTGAIACGAVLTALGHGVPMPAIVFAARRAAREKCAARVSCEHADTRFVVRVVPPLQRRNPSAGLLLPTRRPSAVAHSPNPPAVYPCRCAAASLPPGSYPRRPRALAFRRLVGVALQLPSVDLLAATRHALLGRAAGNARRPAALHACMHRLGRTVRCPPVAAHA